MPEKRTGPGRPSVAGGGNKGGSGRPPARPGGNPENRGHTGAKGPEPSVKR